MHKKNALLSNNDFQKIVSLKTENKILKQRILSAKLFIDEINYLFSDILLHKPDREIVDQKTFDMYTAKNRYVRYANKLIKENSNEMWTIRKKYERKF